MIGAPERAPPPGRPDERFVGTVPYGFARRHLVLCIVGEGSTQGPALLLCGPQTRPDALHNTAAALGLSTGDGPPAAVRVDAEELARWIDDAYGQQALSAAAAGTQRTGVPVIELEDHSGRQGASAAEEELLRLAAAGDADVLTQEGKGPVVRLVDSLLFSAISAGASDLHVQPLADSTLVRMRTDGVLVTARRMSAGLAAALVSRVKVMARMDVAERRAPQDGRASVTVGRGPASRSIDLRISTIPSAFGERMVVRLLDSRRAGAQASIDALSMPDDVRTAYLDRASRSSGIVLVTGPTGSGKTTTLYATLRWICERSFTGGRTADVNVMTIEDPIEYDLGAGGSGQGSLPISQTQVDPKKGVTFASGLRHILRQDPDVIMVGEVRDQETARIAIAASLTGHLVFSTLHTNDAPSSVTRLLDLGVEPFLVASSLSCVLAQRLVRLVHGPCAGAGCGGCLGSGFKGRGALFELLCSSGELRSALAQRPDAESLRRVAVASGMRRLAQEGERLVLQGLTTRAEVARVTMGAEQ